MKLFSSILFLILCCGIVSIAQQDIPTVRQRVNDETGTLSKNEIRTLEKKVYDFENETSNQIVVLIVSSLTGYSLEDFTYRVAEKNKVGKKGRDNGILFFIAKEDREMRIEVGYGLEGVLTDALSSQIIRKVIAPRFNEGDFYGGIGDGLEAIIAATKGEFKSEGNRNNIKTFSPLIIILLIFFFGILPRIFGGGRRSSIGSQGYRSNFPWWWGGFGGGSGGGFSGGSFGGGGGFGGFSGGGGSFGGGGASGRW
ncbi:MAG: TPM domain-containing protein [Bacteroidota bacterium]|nr:TPM domain-containing protein [Bacteroidota bacterium]